MKRISIFLLALLVLSGCGPASIPPTPGPLPIASLAPTASPIPVLQPTPTLAAKRVLFVIFSQFEETEYGTPRAILEEQGILISVASSELRSVSGHRGKKIQPDLMLSAVTTADYDAIVFIGGYGYDRNNAEAIRIAQEAVTLGKVVAAICIAPITLVNAGVLKDKRATTSLPGSVIKQAGGIYTGAVVERDGLIITGNGPGASRKFGEAIAAALAAQTR
jgi:protease I